MHLTYQHQQPRAENSQSAIIAPPRSSAQGPQTGTRPEAAAFEPLGTFQDVISELSHCEPDAGAVLSQLSHATVDPTAIDASVTAVIAFANARPYFDLADYMDRTWITEPAPGKSCAARVHHVLRSDHDRALHDHPWHNASIVLSGGYWEVMPGRFQAAIEQFHDPVAAKQGQDHLLPEGFLAEVQELNALIQVGVASTLSDDQIDALRGMGVVWRAPMSYTPRLAHSLHRLIVPQGQTAWSLFVMRPKLCEWGFLAPDGWMHNTEYLTRLGKDA